MQSNLNKLIAKHVFRQEWEIVNDQVRMTPKSKLKKIPNFCKDLNWAWKAVNKILDTQTHIGVADISHDQYTTRMNIHDVNGKIATKIDLCHTKSFLTFSASLAICALCATGISQEEAIDALYKNVPPENQDI